MPGCRSKTRDVAERGRRGNFRVRRFEKFGEVIQLRHVEHDGFEFSLRDKTAERFAAFQ
jgi:hypothetical protein